MERSDFTITKAVTLPALSPEGEAAVEALAPIFAATIQGRADLLMSALLQPPIRYEPAPIAYVELRGRRLGPRHWVAMDWRGGLTVC